MKGADTANACYAVLVGEDKLANGTVCVKDLESKEEKTIFLGEF